MNIVITGGSRGIGLAVTKRLASDGHKILIVGRDESALQAVESTLSTRPLTACMDIGENDSADRLLRYAQEQHFSPDCLVLNAATFGKPGRSVIEQDVSELEQIFKVNLFASYRLVRAFLPDLKNGTNPHIFFIGSTAALRKDTSLYGISKAALRNYVLGLREELKPLNVGVTLIHPGGTFTERRASSDTVAHDRLLESDDIAKLIQSILLLSPQAVVEEIIVRPMLGDTY